MMVYLLFAMLTIMAWHSVETYRLSDNHLRSSESNENKFNELNDPYVIERLQKLQAILSAINGERSDRFMRESRFPDHLMNTRLVANRRPGLLRLKKSIHDV